MEVKLYDVFEEEDFIKLIKIKFNETFDPNKELISIREEALFGEFYLTNSYGFKKCYGGYQCLITPTESAEKITVSFIKAEGDRGKEYYTRYKSKNGGKEEFNPVTKTGGWEDISVTKKRLKQ